jgi:hypothetical protein
MSCCAYRNKRVTLRGDRTHHLIDLCACRRFWMTAIQSFQGAQASSRFGSVVAAVVAANERRHSVTEACSAQGLFRFV